MKKRNIVKTIPKINIIQYSSSGVHCSRLYDHFFLNWFDVVDMFNSFTVVLYLWNRKHVPCFYRVIQTRVEIWENEKCCGNTSRRRVFPQLFRVLPNFHECLYNSIETRSTCLLFLLENTTTRKRKKTCKLSLSKFKFSLLAPSLRQQRALVVSVSSYTNTIFNQSARVLSYDCFLIKIRERELCKNQ